MERQKFYFWALLNVLMVVVIVGLVFFALPAIGSFKASYPPSRTITVTAEGKTTATPDLAEISFSVLTQGNDPQALSANNIDKMNAVLKFVSSQGIAASDTATTAYDLQPNYKYDTNTGRQSITGYTLTQTVTIKVHDLTKVAPILGGLAPLGVNQIGGVNFTFNDPNAMLAPARADAFAKAKAKAMEMASEAGVTLGDPVNVVESGGTPPPRPYYAASGFGGAVAESSVPTIQPGSQDVTDDVTITYALR
ncbi:MAG TPA: SIMPL domain-containing protein [Candidatus Paceibacterota bacterium]|nr:SIMPL domain-containing protein [Candidatus Paceibacterota bacterium]